MLWGPDASVKDFLMDLLLLERKRYKPGPHVQLAVPTGWLVFRARWKAVFAGSRGG